MIHEKNKRIKGRLRRRLKKKTGRMKIKMRKLKINEDYTRT